MVDSDCQNGPESTDHRSIIKIYAKAAIAGFQLEVQKYQLYLLKNLYKLFKNLNLQTHFSTPRRDW